MPDPAAVSAPIAGMVWLLVFVGSGNAPALPFKALTFPDQEQCEAGARVLRAYDGHAQVSCEQVVEGNWGNALPKAPLHPHAPR